MTKDMSGKIENAKYHINIQLLVVLFLLVLCIIVYGGTQLQKELLMRSDTTLQASTPLPTAGNIARPFLKWIGGKTQLLPKLQAHFPVQLASGRIKTYVEPFVGGGAVFLFVAQSYAVERFVISDTNEDLIRAYWTIQKHVDELIDVLDQLQTHYLKLREDARSAFYYKTRSAFNAQRGDVRTGKFNAKWIERTAQLMFLNKTCFNGLFRVNSAGEFNASFGKYDHPKICDDENLKRVSAVLSRAEILLCDFEDVLSHLDERSFVYLDPPYRPISETSNFTSYSPTSFTALDQERLARFCQTLCRRKALVMMSNSDPTNIDPDDSYFEQHYPRFKIMQTEANRMVNCKADRRGKIRELLLMNY